MIRVFTDGSYKHGIIAYGFLIICNGVEVSLQARTARAITSLKNVEAELMAVISAFEELDKMFSELIDERIILAHDLSIIRSIFSINSCEKFQMNGDEEEIDTKNTKNKHFLRYAQEKIKALVNKLQCNVSLEKIVSHNHEIHNRVDRVLSIILDYRLKMKEFAEKTKKKRREVSLQNSGSSIIKVSNSLFSKYEFDYMNSIINKLSKLQKPIHYSEIEEILTEKNGPFIKSKSKFKRDLRTLLNDMVLYGYISEIDDETYEYKPVKLTYCDLANVEKRNEIPQYVNDYMNFIVNYIKKVKIPVSEGEIALYSKEKKYEWIPRKFEGRSLKELLEYMVSIGKLKKSSEGYYLAEYKDEKSGK
ncbi:MAG: hypothetical protein ABDH59_00930, partial [Fervidobacterium sp.]